MHACSHASAINILHLATTSAPLCCCLTCLAATAAASVGSAPHGPSCAHQAPPCCAGCRHHTPAADSRAIHGTHRCCCCSCGRQAQLNCHRCCRLLSCLQQRQQHWALLMLGWAGRWTPCEHQPHPVAAGVQHALERPCCCLLTESGSAVLHRSRSRRRHRCCCCCDAQHSEPHPQRDQLLMQERRLKGCA